MICAELTSRAHLVCSTIQPLVVLSHRLERSHAAALTQPDITPSISGGSSPGSLSARSQATSADDHSLATSGNTPPVGSAPVTFFPRHVHSIFQRISGASRDSLPTVTRIEPLTDNEVPSNTTPNPTTGSGASTATATPGTEVFYSHWLRCNLSESAQGS